MTKNYSESPYQDLILKLQKQLENQEEHLLQLKTLFTNIPADVYVKDKEGIWISLNKHCAISLYKMGFILSPNEEEVLGKTDQQLFDRETAEGYRLNDLAVMNTRQEATAEEKTVLPSGEEVVLLSTKRPLFNMQGEVIGIIGNTIDITYIKKMENELKVAKEQAESASHAKTEFLENMRHDIRTPLAGIVGCADILKMESDTPQVKQYAEHLIVSSHALLDLLDEVLEAIKVSSGEIPKLKKKFNLKKTLEHIIDLNRAKAAEKKLKLTLDYDAAIPRYLIGDKIRIHRTILELIANALNFTHTGFVRLSVQLAKQESQTCIIQITVEDSGIGIAKDKQQELYIHFKRLTPSYQGIYKGAGLGLSVVKQFIEEIHGEIYVESQINKGARFTCIIPLQTPLLENDLGVDEEEQLEGLANQNNFSDAMNGKSPQKQESKHRILVIEDNKIAQAVAQSLLNHLACAVDIAETGKQALALWKERSYDLIFMDIGLADIDGYELSHLFRQQELIKNTHIPIIALTAHADDDNKKKCIEAGMNALLIKPLTAKNCSDIVNLFIPGQQKSEPSSVRQNKITFDENELFDLSSYPLLDLQQALKTTGNEQVLAQMLEFMVRESLPEDQNELQKSHETADWQQTQNIAHKIKGGAVYVGTIRLKMACQFIERYWKAGETELLERLYQQLLTVIEQSMIAIEEWVRIQNS